MLKVILSFKHALDDFSLSFTSEGNLAREHDVKDNAKRPNVYLAVIFLVEHLRRDIIW